MPIGLESLETFLCAILSSLLVSSDQTSSPAALGIEAHLKSFSL